MKDIWRSLSPAIHGYTAAEEIYDINTLAPEYSLKMINFVYGNNQMLRK